MMNSNMSSQTDTPSFFLYRSNSAGESFDPTAGIQFYPPKDSDELFDALRLAFPNVKSHSERMRDAVINFLLNERDADQAQSVMTSTPSTLSWPSNSSSSSTLSSPDLIDLATPASVASPVPTMSRQTSRSSAGHASMEQMTGVFSLSASSQPKTRIRRKMTDSEKAEYRRRRLVKACDKCSKRKRKCHHNQEQMETVQSLAKITKRKSPSGSVGSGHAARDTPLIPELADTDELDPLSFFTDDSLYSTGADVNMSLMDFSFNPQSVQDGTWPWSNTQDWTLLDTQPMHSMGQSGSLFGESNLFANQYPSPTGGSPTMNTRVTEPQAATHTWHTHAAMTMDATINPDLLRVDQEVQFGQAMPSSANFGYIGIEATDAAFEAKEPIHAPHRIPLDVPSYDVPLLHNSNIRPSRSPHPGSVVNDKAVALSGASHGAASIAGVIPSMFRPESLAGRKRQSTSETGVSANGPRPSAAIATESSIGISIAHAPHPSAAIATTSSSGGSTSSVNGSAGVSHAFAASAATGSSSATGSVEGHNDRARDRSGGGEEHHRGDREEDRRIPSNSIRSSRRVAKPNHLPVQALSARQAYTVDWIVPLIIDDPAALGLQQGLGVDSASIERATLPMSLRASRSMLDSAASEPSSATRMITTVLSRGTPRQALQSSLDSIVANFASRAAVLQPISESNQTCHSPRTSQVIGSAIHTRPSEGFTALLTGASSASVTTAMPTAQVTKQQLLIPTPIVHSDSEADKRDEHAERHTLLPLSSETRSSHGKASAVAGGAINFSTDATLNLVTTQTSCRAAVATPLTTAKNRLATRNVVSVYATSASTCAHVSSEHLLRLVGTLTGELLEALKLRELNFGPDCFVGNSLELPVAKLVSCV